MRSLRLVFLVTLALRVSLAGQDRPHFEVFGGYSLERIAPCGLGNDEYPCNAETGFLAPTTNYNGWDASLTGYFARFLGVTADFSGHYGSYRFGNQINPPYPSVSRYSYMFGPVFAWRTPKVTSFAHLLLGRTSESLAGSIGNYNVFSWAVGGGLDVSVSKRIAIRIAQLDYESVHVPGNLAAKGFRYSSGMVFRF